MIEQRRFMYISRSEIMKRVKSKDTSNETMLRKLLWKKSVRYRKNCDKIFGKLDICINIKLQYFATVSFGIEIINEIENKKREKKG